MMYELSPEEVATIAGWYAGSAQDCDEHNHSAEMFDLLEKLNIAADYMDLIWTPPEHYLNISDQTKAAITARRDLIVAYRKRHPDDKVVQETMLLRPE